MRDVGLLGALGVRIHRRQEGLYQHPHAPYMCPLHTEYFPSPPLADYGLSRPSRAFPAIALPSRPARRQNKTRSSLGDVV